MNLLIVAATEGEIKPLPVPPLAGRCFVEVLITGVGMLSTAYALTRHLSQRDPFGQINPKGIPSDKYDLVLQVGVGGSFDRDIELGSVVFVTSEQYGDLGAEDHDEYLDIFEMDLFDKNTLPYTNGKLLTPMLPIHEQIALPQVSGLTVNTVSGKGITINRRVKKYGAVIESMEGAAFHYVCLLERVAFAQVRAISNYIAPRDKSQWKMKEAIMNLNNWLIDFIERVNT
jgi:futalosine hydrolase